MTCKTVSGAISMYSECNNITNGTLVSFKERRISENSHSVDYRVDTDSAANDF